MSKHTPGPHKANNGYTIIRDGVRHFPIHAKKRGMIGLALREGDANLWASAPDLLEALKGMLGAWNMVCDSNGWERDHIQQQKDAVAAIAKATGEST